MDLDPLGAQHTDRVEGRRFYRIGDGQKARKFPLHCDKHHAMTFPFQALCLRRQRARVYIHCLKQYTVPQRKLFPADRPRYPFARERPKILRRTQIQIPFLGRLDDGRRQRMLASSLQARAQAQEFRFAPSG